MSRCRLVTTVVGLAVAAACSSPSDPAASAAPDATPAEQAAAPDPTGGVADSMPAALRAAHIRARQAEGAADPRFRVLADAGGLRTSRQRGLEARFDLGGVALSADDGLTGRLETSAIRCGARELASPVGPPSIDPAAPNRVTRGPSSATEWFVHGPLGLEQGYDLELAGCTTTLTVEVATPGFVPSMVGDNVRLAAVDGSRALRYGDLFANDARGVALPARFEVAPGRVSITVDVAGAVGPITIDPLIYTELQRIDGSDGDGQTNDNFGFAVAISGDTALVGAYTDVLDGRVRGSVYIYVRDGAGWVLQQKLAVPGTSSNFMFGRSVALVGDTAMIAAVGGASVYRFERDGTSWSLVQTITPADLSPGMGFGTSLAFDGATLVVGATGVDGALVNEGAVYVYTLADGAWVQQQKLVAQEPAAAYQLGARVALSGDTVVAGGSSQNTFLAFVRADGVWSQQAKVVVGGVVTALSLDADIALVGAASVTSRKGAVFVVIRTGATWTTEETLVAPDGTANDEFGTSIAQAGDTLVIGAAQADVDGVVDSGGFGQGVAYVYVRTGTSWTFADKLSAPGLASDDFGQAVATDGEAILVGAPLAMVGDHARQGAAHVFERRGTAWSDGVQLDSGRGAGGDSFGASVAVSGDTAIIGSINGEAAWIYVLVDGSWTLQQRLVSMAGPTGYGRVVALAGDTAVVGAPDHDIGGNSGLNVGAVHVHVRNGVAWTEQATLLASDASAFAGFGSALAIAGDTIVVGAPRAVVSSQTKGAAYVFVRDGAAWTEQTKLVAADGAASDQFGMSVAMTDDADTVLVGALQGDTAITNCGTVYVFDRTGAGWTEVQELAADNAAESDQFGAAVDVSASGATALIGAPGADRGPTNSGSAYLFVRDGGGWVQQTELVADNATATDFFGGAVSVTDELALVGARGADGAFMNQGFAYVFARQGGAWAQEARFSAGNADAADTFGASVVAIGPAPGGGYHTLVGAPNDDGDEVFGNLNQGSVYFGRLAPPGPCAGKPAGFVCRASAGGCDVAEVCDGASEDCPADAFVDAGTECRASAGACDVSEACSGDSAACPADAKSTAVCRASAGACDAAETCDGTADHCPADGFIAAGTECRASNGACDVAEACSGDSAACPADGFAPAATTCREAAGDCDVAEACSGDSAACPADAKSTVVCRAAAGACDVAETCDGAGNDCPADGFVAAGTACRGAAGVCDVAEVCTGDAPACPDDALAAAGTACDPAGETCAASAETCSGASVECAIDDVLPCTPPTFTSAPSPVLVNDCTPLTVVPPADRPTAVDASGTPLAVECEDPSGVGIHEVECSATDGYGNRSTTTITVTVLASLRVAFQSPLEDDNVRDAVATDRDVGNKFKAGSTVVHKVKLYACNGVDVTASLASSVTVKLDVSQRDQLDNALFVDLPEVFTGEGGPGGVMVPTNGAYQYNLKTSGFTAGTVNNTRYFQSLVTVAYDSNPTIAVGREDSALESKP